MSNHNLAPSLKPRSWRTAEMHDRYVSEREADVQADDYCPLCAAETIRSFEHWRIIPNKYPYDAVARTHDQLVPKRHTDGEDLSVDELSELKTLKIGALNESYTYVVEALPGAKSIPGNFHLHLLTPKMVG